MKKYIELTVYYITDTKIDKPYKLGNSLVYEAGVEDFSRLVGSGPLAGPNPLFRVDSETGKLFQLPPRVSEDSIGDRIKTYPHRLIHVAKNTIKKLLQ